MIDVKETGLDGGRLAIPPVIARSVSDVAISVFFAVILRERSDRRISGGNDVLRFFAALRMTVGRARNDRVAGIKVGKNSKCHRSKLYLISSLPVTSRRQ